MYRSLILAGALALSTTAAFGAVVDFEDEAPLAADPTLFGVGTAYINGMITFTSTEVMQLVGVGPNPRSAFVPNDDPGQSATGPADFGKVFLTGDFNDDTDMTLSFSKAVTSAAFDIVDIDGGNDNNVGDNSEEQFVFTFINGLDVQASQTFTSRDLTGPLNDAGVIRVSYTGLFDKVTIVGTTPGGKRNIGWGIDNIELAPVPLPAAGLMLLGALGGLGLMRRAKRKS
ncbi:hypothetical protein ROLI_023600 [Roseobacter fucihabitans]|uniref:VPLPA-CTERM protein sorting domain-containing protein n=1 Tax=Roseobacter fucihabitans TaxID=1537242 RepID=A0ABZ2BVB0_9RHOB|nr:VPLPA-CTERM sorting domain-containing protein [Roseobacter litoralis]MBC6965772.1 hypothetical protein [Roseobacter litoralis]